MEDCKKRIFYVHGFNSYKGSDTVKAMRESLGCDVFEMSYESDCPFEENLKSLRKQYRKLMSEDGNILIGTSLGGFYVYQVSDMENVSTIVMINPSVNPDETLKRFLGENQNFKTGKKYVLTEEIANSYKIKKDLRNTICPKHLLLSKIDELLDFSESQDYWQNSAKITYIQGGHRLSDFSEFKKTVSEGI